MGFSWNISFEKYIPHAKINSLSTGSTQEFLKSINWLSLSHFLGPIFSSFFFKKVIFSHWFRFRTNARWFRRKIRVLKQSLLAKILDRHLDTKWARLWSPAPSGPVCEFWLGKPRKLLLTTFFIVFSVKRVFFMS